MMDYKAFATENARREFQTPIQRQYARNADVLQRMLTKADLSGTFHGYTVAELTALVAEYRALARSGTVPCAS